MFDFTLTRCNSQVLLILGNMNVVLKHPFIGQGFITSITVEDHTKRGVIHYIKVSINMHPLGKI